MPISIDSGKQIRRVGGIQSATTFAQATSSATQTLTIDKDVVEFTAGPTGAFANVYTMGAGNEGQPLSLVYLATGAGGTTASLGDIQVIPTGTATGDLLAPQSSITFRNAGDFWYGQFLGGKWRTISRTTGELGLSTASGAIPLTVDEFRLMRATGTDQTYTLPASGAYAGQRILLTALTGTCIRIVTPAVMRKFTSVLLGDDAGAGGSGKRYAMLEFTGGAWSIVSPINLDASATTCINASAIVT